MDVRSRVSLPVSDDSEPGFWKRTDDSKWSDSRRTGTLLVERHDRSAFYAEVSGIGGTEKKIPDGESMRFIIPLTGNILLNE